MRQISDNQIIMPDNNGAVRGSSSKFFSDARITNLWTVHV